MEMKKLFEDAWSYVHDPYDTKENRVECEKCLMQDLHYPKTKQELYDRLFVFFGKIYYNMLTAGSYFLRDGQIAVKLHHPEWGLYTSLMSSLFLLLQLDHSVQQSDQDIDFKHLHLSELDKYYLETEEDADESQEAEEDTDSLPV